MTMVVVDASAALAWSLRSQATASAERMLLAADQYEFIAPSILSFEVYNVLVSLARRGLLSDDAFQETVGAVEAVDILLADPIGGPDVSILANHAKAVGLSLFDSCYFQLAVREDCGIATRDQGLIAVCQRTGVPVFDLRG